VTTISNASGQIPGVSDIPGSYRMSHARVAEQQITLARSFMQPLKKDDILALLSPGTFLDMMYMPDALEAAIQLMEVDASG